MRRDYRVTVTMQREYAASITVRASSQAEADQAAIAAFWKWACEEGLRGLSLGLPPPWEEHESNDHDPEIDTRFRCIDCRKDTAAASITPSATTSGPPRGQMMECCASRVSKDASDGRSPIEDFTALCPTASAWRRHLAARTSPNQLDMWDSAEKA